MHIASISQFCYISEQVNKNGPNSTSLKTNENRRGRGDSFLLKPAQLKLADGIVIHGQTPAWQTANYTGEVVFSTGMTGYVESLTDPSYAGQILAFTYPLIGNYGVRETWGESPKIYANGVIVSEAALNWSHSAADRSLLQWLFEQNVPILIDADTRMLTKHLRSRGTMLGTIGSAPRRPTNKKWLIPRVSIAEPKLYNTDHKKTVILVDCGAKENIVRSLQKYPLTIKRVPYNYDYTNEDYDGVLLSNGPGDPTDYQETIQIAEVALKKNKPVFGICLGSQLLGLAAGASTYKLPFGHRGHNQPCQDATTERSFVTSQNHGYAIDESTLPRSWKVSFRNLNDGSVEGIEHRTKPFFAVQFHPEACPGPTDTKWLFDKFYETIQ